MQKSAGLKNAPEEAWQPAFHLKPAWKCAYNPPFATKFIGFFEVFRHSKSLKNLLRMMVATIEQWF